MAIDDRDLAPAPERKPYYDWSLLKQLGQGVKEALVGTDPTVVPGRIAAPTQPDPYPRITARLAAGALGPSAAPVIPVAPATPATRPGLATPAAAPLGAPLGAATQGSGETDPTFTANLVAAGAKTPGGQPTARAALWDVPAGLAPMRFPTFGAGGTVNRTPAEESLNQLLAGAASRAAQRTMGEEVPDVIPHVGVEPPPGVTYENIPNPWARVSDPVGPGFTPWAPGDVPRDIGGLVGFGRGPLPNRAMPGTALDKSLQEYYRDIPGGQEALGRPGAAGGRMPGVPTYRGTNEPVGTIRTLQGNIPGFVVPQSMGGTGQPIVGGISPGQAMQLTPAQRQYLALNPPPAAALADTGDLAQNIKLAQAASEARAKWAHGFAKAFAAPRAPTQHELTQEGLSRERFAFEKEQALGKTKAAEEERPIKEENLRGQIAKRKVDELNAQQLMEERAAKTARAAEAATPKGQAQAVLDKMKTKPGYAAWRDSPAGIETLEAAGHAVDPDRKILSRIGVIKELKGKKLDQLTLEQANAADISMKDIVASGMRGTAKEGLADVEAGVPPGTGWWMRPMRLNPLSRDQAIREARAAATPKQRAIIDQLLENRQAIEAD